MLSSSSKDAGIAQKTLESGLVDKEKAIDTAAPIQKEGADATRKDREAYDKKADNYHDQLEQVDTWKPEKQQSDPISAFGQAGTVFALLAAGLTHAPMANALNAAASAINARRANDDAGYQKAFDAWKENTKLALDKNEAYLNHLNILGAKAKTDPESYINEAKLAAAQYDDKGALKLIASGQYEDLAKLNDARAKNQLELQKAFDDVHDAHEESQILRDTLKQLPADATPQQKAEALGEAKFALAGKKANGGTSLTAMQAKLAQDVYFENKAKGMPEAEAMEDAISKAKTSSQGSRESVMIQRQLVDANDAAAELGNIMELPVSASMGFFGGRQQGHGLFDAAKETLTNSVTSQEVQDYNSQAVGLGRALAGLETGGLQVNEALQKQFEQLALRDGDSQLTKMRKVATMRQQADRALEAFMANPRAGGEQKQLAEKLRGELEKSVPFSVHDVTMYEREGKPGQSMSDYAKSLGLDKSSHSDFPSEAVEQLKKRPETASQFDQIFGQGAAARVLAK